MTNPGPCFWFCILIFWWLLWGPGCALSHEAPQASPSCWVSGTVTQAPDRARCFETFDECTQDAVRWGAGPWACEGVR